MSEPLQNSQQLEDLHRQLAELRAEKNRQISEYQAQAWEMAGRASKAESERDAMQAELSSLKTDMFVLNNDMGYTTGILDDVLKQRDALRAELEDVDNERINVIADAEAVLRESAKKQDALQARVKNAGLNLVEFWRTLDCNRINDALKILTGECES